MVVRNELNGDFWQSVKSAGREVVSLPGKVVSTAIRPISKGVGEAAKNIISPVGEAAGSALKNITSPLNKTLIIVGSVGLVAVVGYICFQKKGLSFKSPSKAVYEPYNELRGCHGKGKKEKHPAYRR